MRQSPKAPRSFRTAFRGLESLEERRVMAAVSWDGGGNDMLWNNPLNWSNNALPTAADTVTIAFQAGKGPVELTGSPGWALRLTTSQDLTIGSGARLEVEEELTATTGADLLIAGELVWRDGEMQAGGLTTIAAGGRLTHTGVDSKLIQRRLVSHGTLAWEDSNLRLDGPQAELVNQVGAVIHATASGHDLDSTSGALPVSNLGSLVFETDPTKTTEIHAVFDNEGSIEVRSGSLQLEGGGSSSGSFTIEFGAGLRFEPDGGRGYAFRNGTVFAGVGDVDIWNTGHSVTGSVDWGDHGVVVLGNARTLVTEGPTVMRGSLTFESGEMIMDHSVTAFDQFTMNGGSLTGTGSMWVHGRFDWNGGTIEGSGSIRVQRGAEWNLAGNSKTLDGTRQIWNNGRATWSEGAILISTSAAIQNLRGGKFDADAGGYSIHGAGQLVNKGFFEVAPGTGSSVTVQDGVTFSNLTQAGLGGVKVVNGELALYGEVPQFKLSTLSYGLWSINSGARISSPSQVRLTWNNSSVTLQGSARFDAISGLNRNHGQLTLDRNAQPQFLTSSGPDSFTNSGLLVKMGSGDTRVAPALRNIGRITVEGPSSVTNPLSIGRLIVENAGQGTFVNEGQLDIGVRAEFKVTGDFRQSTGGSFSTTLLGTQSFQMGRLVVDGQATLAGSLTIGLDPSASVSTGQVFQYLTTAPLGRVGVFGSVSLPTLNGGAHTGTVTYAHNGAALRILAG